MKLRYHDNRLKEAYDTETAMSIPWDSEKNQPLDIDGEIGRLWKEAGSPKPEPPP